MRRRADVTEVVEIKEPFDIDEVFRRLRRAVADLPKAAMFDLRDQGFRSPYEQLVGSLISTRTRDETTLAVCQRLFNPYGIFLLDMHARLPIETHCRAAA
jgi:endonuclease III